MPQKTIYVTMRPAEAEALLELARREDRDPRRQAARFIREGLERAGAIQDRNTVAGRQPASAVPA